jgi:hypothetical protein
VIGKGKPERLGPKVNADEWAGETWVQQYLCKTHRIKFRALPEFLLPRKHYAAPVVDEAIAARVLGVSLGSYCDAWGLLNAQTPARWLRSFVQRLSEVRVWVGRQLQTLGVPRARAPDQGWDFAEVWRSLRQLQEACQSKKMGHFAISHFIWVSRSSLPSIFF